MNIRDQVVSAFIPDDGYTYSHKLPFQYSNFIDGMAWVGMLCGAARIKEDCELIELTEGFINNLLLVGPDARNFGPTGKVSSDWLHSGKMPGFSYKRKPQAFAGPAAVHWAVSKGARIDLNRVPDVSGTARFMCATAWLYGHLIKPVPALRQHINSVMFAHLMLGKTPPSSMRFLAKDNPVYQYIFGTHVQEFIYPSNSPWPAKNWPGTTGTIKPYTPICTLVGQLLS